MPLIPKRLLAFTNGRNAECRLLAAHLCGLEGRQRRQVRRDALREALAAQPMADRGYNTQIPASASMLSLHPAFLSPAQRR